MNHILFIFHSQINAKSIFTKGIQVIIEPLSSKIIEKIILQDYIPTFNVQHDANKRKNKQEKIHGMKNKKKKLECSYDCNIKY